MIPAANHPFCRWVLAALLGLASLLPVRADVQEAIKGLPARADIEQRLGVKIPLALPFTDETGQRVALGKYFGERPVILQLGYNHCWLMCDVVTGALVRSLQDLRLNPGSDFDVVFVSIDPHESWQLAAHKRDEYVRSFGRSRTGRGWHFLTGSEPEIRALSEAVGFHYFYDPPSQQFAHASGIIVTTPEGVTSKYFYGVEFPPSELRQSILDAAGGTIGSKVHALLMLCYHWNPLTGKYGTLISGGLKLLCLGTVAALGGFIFASLRREAIQRRTAASSF